MRKQKTKNKRKHSFSHHLHRRFFSNGKKNSSGFSLIEIMVVISIISLLSAVAMVAFQSSRQKSRDVKRLSDMTQMATAMELYFNTYKGYPTNEWDLVPNFVNSLVVNPTPADGACPSLTYPLTSEVADSYYYYPSPTAGSYVIDGVTVYPDYIYYFCLGDVTGHFPPGVHWVSPKGVR